MISERFILDTLAWKHKKRTPLFRLAHRLEVSPSWVSGIMRGQIPAGRGDPRILAWAKITGTPRNQIFQEHKPPRGKSRVSGRKAQEKGFKRP